MICDNCRKEINNRHQIEFGDIIRERRKDLRLTLREVSRNVGISHPYLSVIEHGKKFPSDIVFTKICDVLKLNEMRGRNNGL